MQKTFKHALVNGGAIDVTASYTWDGSEWLLNDDEGIVVHDGYFDDLSEVDKESVTIAAENIAKFLPAEVEYEREHGADRGFDVAHFNATGNVRY